MNKYEFTNFSDIRNTYPEVWTLYQAIMKKYHGDKKRECMVVLPLSEWPLLSENSEEYIHTLISTLSRLKISIESDVSWGIFPLVSYITFDVNDEVGEELVVHISATVSEMYDEMLTDSDRS